MTGKEKVLIIGYGNPAREDDGLGPLAAEAVDNFHLIDVTVDSNYQLTVEDAHAVAGHDVVVFIDASIDCREPFEFTRLIPKRSESFSSHSVTPELVLGLAQELFGVQPAVYILVIRGYSFSMFIEKLTGRARDNLVQAVAFLMETLTSREFHVTSPCNNHNPRIVCEEYHEKREICDSLH